MSEQEKEQVIVIGGSEYVTTYTKKFINRKVWTDPNPNNVVSYIPGTILEIKVEEGQQVEEGEVILILEAMKMSNSVEMPFDGKVVKINVVKGQKIPKDYLMIEIEPTN
ncbi:MAG TPA: biotin/lipoyl-binding protein [Prolixibacteraceae bacterium]|nr:biotin/lipoyl-binding protein [Prolixibacteraceae bacterium]HPR84512.1 biotin/lipoyl-binding protein [Prolixibacteraceae bacterium]